MTTDSDKSTADAAHMWTRPSTLYVLEVALVSFLGLQAACEDVWVEASLKVVAVALVTTASWLKMRP